MNLHAKLDKRRKMREKARKIKLVKKTCMVLAAGIVMGAGFDMLRTCRSGQETRISIVCSFNKGVRNLGRCSVQDRTEAMRKLEIASESVIK